MEYTPTATADKSLPYSAYRMGTYVGNWVKVVILIAGDDDGSMPVLADKWTTADGKTDLAGMLEHPYSVTDAWDFGCDGREWSSSIAAVGFVEDFDRGHMDAFAKAHPELRLTVSYETARYNGAFGYRRGKADGRHTLNVWRANDGTGMKELSYEEFVALEGEGTW